MIYAYIRVSTQTQTLASQRYEINEYCRQNSLHVDHWVTESVSGTKAPEKRSLGKLIHKMKCGDLLLCTELSRLGRNMLMVMSVLNSCVTRGIHVHTIKDHFDLSDNLNSKIIAFAFSLAAEIERNLISQRTREALAAKKYAGVQLGRPRGSSKKKMSVFREKDVLLKMIESGVPLTSIARKYHIHRNTLHRYMKEFF